MKQKIHHESLRYVLKTIFAAIVLFFATHPLYSMTEAERREYLDNLLKTLPDAPAFTQWLKTSGELPPDFDALPCMNYLPDPLRFLDGRPVRNQEDWKTRREEIHKLFEQYALGTFPPHPKLDRAEQTDETQHPGYRIRHVRLVFGPESKGQMHVELIIPDGPGPFPVFMGAIWTRPWAQQALRRKYLCAIYAGSDGQDDADALAALYPKYDFALLPRRAWAGTMVLDYLETLKEADMRHVGITGHSRDGKQALIQAGLDDRIAAVIVSSSGVGGSLPYRLAGERGMAEGIESTTRAFPTWFHPRLRFFSGREDRLPVDGNLLAALVAPRACMIAYGINDLVSDPWSDEQSYLSALKVYRLLGHPERLALYHRPGFHGTTPGDIENYLDWFDIQFGRSNRTWNSDLLYGYDFDRWLSESGEKVDIAQYPQHKTGDCPDFRGHGHQPKVGREAVVDENGTVPFEPKKDNLLTGDPNTISPLPLEKGTASPLPLGKGTGTDSPLPLGEGPGVRAVRGPSPLPLGEGPGVRAVRGPSPLPLGEGPGVRASSEPASAADSPQSPTGATISTTADWEKKIPEIQKSVLWMLGDEPPMMPGMGGMFPGLPPGGRGGRGGRGAAPGTPPAANPQQITPNLALMVIQSGASYGWRSPEKDQAANQLGIRFGYNVSGDLYYPADAPTDAKLPVVIWLHGYGYAMGYEWGYRRDLSPILALVKAGYAVFAFDQMGFGSRIAEAARFYDRYPHWSELGRMVEDTRAAIDMLEKREHIDPEKIYLFGYSTLGGTLGLYTAALDSRVKGVVSICGFTPMRTDTADRGTGGIARYSHIHGLLPRLGFFIGNESRIPYDYQDLIAAIAPRPVYILAPQLDRDSTPADVRSAVESARKVFSLYNASDKLLLDAPWDYNRLSEATQDGIVKWMKENMQ